MAGFRKVCYRKLQKHVALDSYLKLEGLTDPPFKQLDIGFNGSLTELHLLSYQDTNSQGPLIFLFYKFQQRFMNKLASKFAKLDMICTLKEAHKSFSCLDVSIEKLNIIY